MTTGGSLQKVASHRGSAHSRCSGGPALALPALSAANSSSPDSATCPSLPLPSPCSACFVTRALMRQLIPVELVLKATAVGDPEATPSVLAGAVVRVLIDKARAAATACAHECHACDACTPCLCRQVRLRCAHLPGPAPQNSLQGIALFAWLPCRLTSCARSSPLASRGRAAGSCSYCM